MNGRFTGQRHGLRIGTATTSNALTRSRPKIGPARMSAFGHGDQPGRAIVVFSPRKSQICGTVEHEMMCFPRYLRFVKPFDPGNKSTRFPFRHGAPAVDRGFGGIHQ